MARTSARQNIRKSLKTKVWSPAKLRLRDFLNAQIRPPQHRGRALLAGDRRLRNQSETRDGFEGVWQTVPPLVHRHRAQPLAGALAAKHDEITTDECKAWAARVHPLVSAQYYNNLIGTLKLILAGLAGPDGGERVPVLRRGEDHCVDVLVVERLAHVGDSFGRAFLHFLQILHDARAATLPDVADLIELHPPAAWTCRRVIGGASAGANEREHNLVTGALRPREAGKAQHGGTGRNRGRGLGGGDKPTARNGLHKTFRFIDPIRTGIAFIEGNGAIPQGRAVMRGGLPTRG